MSWNELTDRQKSLDRAIEATGIKLDNSRKCLAKVMKSIGAEAFEEDFVKGRIALRLRVQQLLDETDHFIEKTGKMLDEFDREEVYWEEI